MTRSGITYEADPRHVRIMLEEWSDIMQHSSIARGKDERSDEAEVPLAGPAAHLYRAQDRADLAFATN